MNISMNNKIIKKMKAGKKIIKIKVSISKRNIQIILRSQKKIKIKISITSKVNISVMNIKDITRNLQETKITNKEVLLVEGITEILDSREMIIIEIEALMMINKVMSLKEFKNKIAITIMTIHILMSINQN